ncbi:MAG: beta-galactosidase, partial [Oscillospiraceae bacterium]
DSEGDPVENARNRVSVEVSGAGRLLGMDNGDSTDYEQYKSSDRRLFSGKALAVIGTTFEAGEIHIKITSEGLAPCEIVLDSEAAEHFGVSALQKVEYTVPEKDVPIRKIELTCGNTALDENNKTLSASVKILPENATFNDITCKLVKTNGVESNIAECELKDGKINVAAKGDGEAVLRVYAANGSRYPQVISELKFSVTGLGDAVRDPYTFVKACDYSFGSEPLNIIENGALGGFTKRIYAGFSALDLGKTGTEKFRLYFGNCCNKDIPIEIWDGVPEADGSVLLTTAMFPHNNGWGSFEPCDFELGTRLKGMHSLYFVISDKCIFGGFEFIAEERAFAKLSPADNDEIYGDDYSVNGDTVEKIGNNVVIGFNGMDFGTGTSRVTVCGRTPNEINTIQLRHTADGVQKTKILEFRRSADYTEQSFDISQINGLNDISFVFMPGSNFDFAWFRFEKTGD